MREPRRRPEQDGPAAHRAAPAPAPGSARPATRWTRPPSATWPNGSGRPRGIFDLGGKQARVEELDALTHAPGFWDDSRAAQKVTREAERPPRGDRDVARPRRPSRRPAGRGRAARRGARRRARRPSWTATPASSIRDFRRERTALLFSGEYDDRNALALDQRRRRRHGGDRLGGDAPAHVPALGGAPPLHDRDPRPAGRRAGRHQERDRRRSTAGGPTAGCAPSAACIGWCGSARSTRRTAARRRSRWSRCCPRSTTTSRSSSIGTRSGSTRSARRAPAASTSTRPIPPCG